MFSEGRDLYSADIFEEGLNTDEYLKEKSFNKLCVVDLSAFWVKFVDDKFLSEIFNAITFLAEAVDDNTSYFGNILFADVKVRVVHSICLIVIWMRRCVVVLLFLHLIVVVQLWFLDGVYIIIFNYINELVLLLSRCWFFLFLEYWPFLIVLGNWGVINVLELVLYFGVELVYKKWGE